MDLTISELALIFLLVLLILLVQQPPAVVCNQGFLHSQDTLSNEPHRTLRQIYVVRPHCMLCTVAQDCVHSKRQ